MTMSVFFHSLCSPACNLKRAETDRRRLHRGPEDWAQHRMISLCFILEVIKKYLHQKMINYPCHCLHVSAAADWLLQSDQVLWHGEVWIWCVWRVWAVSEGLPQGKSKPAFTHYLHIRSCCKDVFVNQFILSFSPSFLMCITIKKHLWVQKYTH